MPSINTFNQRLTSIESIFNVLGLLPVISIGSGFVRILAGGAELGAGTVATISLKFFSLLPALTEVKEKRQYNAHYTTTYITSGAQNMFRGVLEMIPGSSIPMTCALMCFHQKGASDRIFLYPLYQPPSPPTLSVLAFKASILPERGDTQPIDKLIKKLSEEQLEWLEEAFEEANFTTYFNWLAQPSTRSNASPKIVIGQSDLFTWFFESGCKQEIYAHIPISNLKEMSITPEVFTRAIINKVNKENFNITIEYIISPGGDILQFCIKKSEDIDN